MGETLKSDSVIESEKSAEESDKPTNQLMGETVKSDSVRESVKSAKESDKSTDEKSENIGGPSGQLTMEEIEEWTNEFVFALNRLKEAIGGSQSDSLLNMEEESNSPEWTYRCECSSEDLDPWIL